MHHSHLILGLKAHRKHLQLLRDRAPQDVPPVHQCSQVPPRCSASWLLFHLSAVLSALKCLETRALLYLQAMDLEIAGVTALLQAFPRCLWWQDCICGRQVDQRPLK